MKILLYHWLAYSNLFLGNNLKQMGHEVYVWHDDEFKEQSTESQEKLCEELKKGYDLVFSYNFFRIVAQACHEREIPYFSWTQDSPLLSLYDINAYYDTNYFFCFDYEQVESLRNRGIKNAFYCPLATDVIALGSAADGCRDLEKRKYQSAVSFVGSLYTERNMLSRLVGFPEYIKGYLDGIVEAQLHLPAIRFSQANIPLDIMEIMHKTLKFSGEDRNKMGYDKLIDNLIDRQVTAIERQRLVEILSDRRDFKLYTTSDTAQYPKVNNCGKVDYYTEMPKVFRCSDININVTLRSIRSGIPLRILDVFASGGFLLTNAQPELELYFKDRESIATFQNLEEMNEKIDYYLLHEEERRKIIENGYRIVANQFDFKVRLPQMFKMAGIQLK